MTSNPTLADAMTWWDGSSPDSQTKRLIWSSVALIALSTIFVSLRLVSRKLSKAGFWVRFLRTSIWPKRLDGIADFATNFFLGDQKVG